MTQSLAALLEIYGITNPETLTIEQLIKLQNVLSAYIKERAKQKPVQQPLF